MSRFLRLTNMLLNTNDIHKIVINPNRYYIHIVGKKIDGYGFNIGVFGMGLISSPTDYIEICETHHPIDYKIVSDWISKNP